jgi:large subunit ribosomal protein L21
MYAVFKSGGKQHRVEEGQIIKLEKLLVDVDATVEFDEILMIANGDDIKVGAPTLKGAKITAKVIEQGRHKKIRIIKFRRRKHHDKQAGHRQYYTAVKIEKIAA